MKSLLLSSIVIVGIVGGALLLKSNRTEPTSARPAQAQRQALPRFVDLGTTTCAPCRVMLGVMEELEQRYPGAMIVEFVNVNSQPEEARRYGIQIIPTQIFYSPDGRELFRHVGVFRAEEVVAKWAELGFPMAQR
jgi:thioredoxin 1